MKPSQTEHPDPHFNNELYNGEEALTQRCRIGQKSGVHLIKKKKKNYPSGSWGLDDILKNEHYVARVVPGVFHYQSSEVSVWFS